MEYKGRKQKDSKIERMSSLKYINMYKMVKYINMYIIPENNESDQITV